MCTFSYKPWIQWLFHDQLSHCLMVGNYKTYIISSAGHPMSDLVGLLVLWMVAYNDRGIGIVLQVPRNSASLVENG
jgi:hypothetical protein